MNGQTMIFPQIGIKLEKTSEDYRFDNDLDEEWWIELQRELQKKYEQEDEDEIYKSSIKKRIDIYKEEKNNPLTPKINPYEGDE